MQYDLQKPQTFKFILKIGCRKRQPCQERDGGVHFTCRGQSDVCCSCAKPPESGMYVIHWLTAGSTLNNLMSFNNSAFSGELCFKGQLLSLLQSSMSSLPRDAFRVLCPGTLQGEAGLGRTGACRRRPRSAGSRWDAGSVGGGSSSSCSGTGMRCWAPGDDLATSWWRGGNSNLAVCHPGP